MEEGREEMTDKPGLRRQKWIVAAILCLIAAGMYVGIYYKVSLYGP